MCALKFSLRKEGMSHLFSGSFWLLLLLWLMVTSPRLVPTAGNCISLVCTTLRFQFPFTLSLSLTSSYSLAFRYKHSVRRYSFWHKSLMKEINRFWGHPRSFSNLPSQNRKTLFLGFILSPFFFLSPYHI